MVLTKEYKICMPMTVEEYRIGQLYMIARHSFEQSSDGEGVEVVANEQCSFIPKFSISIQTRYEDNNGTTENVRLTPEELESREVDFLDIAYDEIKPHHYKEAEDPKFFKSEKTGRGPLVEGWRDTHQPIMCCYKVVHAIREILLLGHRQAFAWMDDWYNMTIDDVRAYEKDMQAKTNNKLKTEDAATEGQKSPASPKTPKTPKSPQTPKTPQSGGSTPTAETRSWFTWS
ncbi:hypothetical protein MSG28_010265 [Choristoneura fumiferana]|uniref:Uncharacterized protein n=1 Tax=Choristoneura fumiferana TaxID=7141 RepID=A0ACC0KJU8_CHOFU|nr:hypothetical protein MSG28_010265 [Choristoneura fumiferana]